MGARQSKHGDNKQAESTALADRQSAEEDTAEKNSNVVRSLQKLTTGFGSPRLSTKLPLKDKRITIEGSIGLLSQASSKALSDLQQDTGTTLPSLKDLADFTFPFENAVFEGGGVKGIAYVGAVKCLEDAGIKLKRFAGSSIGSTVAGLLSVGYTSDELIALYIQDLSIFIRDSHCELLCFLPRLIMNLGLNPGKAFTDWYGRCLAVKTGDPDITFRQIYDRFGTELCVVVMNMNTGREEYFHPKTTPHLKVRTAIRMSISVPGVLEPIQLQHQDGRQDLYIDGGVICNYPIYVFDGWWLSMEPKNHIYSKISSNADERSNSTSDARHLVELCDPRLRFAARNNRTIGFKQTTNSDFFNDTLIAPVNENYADPDDNAKRCTSSRPNTKLARKRMKYLIRQEKDAQLKSQQLDALSRFFELLQKSTDTDGFISKQTFSSLLLEPEGTMTDDHIHLLYGINLTRSGLLKTLPSDDLISPNDFDLHMRSLGLDMNRVLESSAVLRNGNMTGAKNYWSMLQENVTNAARRSFVKPEDVDRTVNIHTDYIEFLDFDVSTKDKEFLVQQGYKHTLVYLQRYVRKHNKKTSHSTLKGKGGSSVSKSDDVDVYDDNDSGNVDSPMFFIDDNEAYDQWITGLQSDNINT